MDPEQRKDNFRDAPAHAHTPHHDDSDLDALGRGTVLGESRVAAVGALIMLSAFSNIINDPLAPEAGWTTPGYKAWTPSRARRRDARWLWSKQVLMRCYIQYTYIYLYYEI